MLERSESFSVVDSIQIRLDKVSGSNSLADKEPEIIEDKKLFSVSIKIGEDQIQNLLEF